MNLERKRFYPVIHVAKDEQAFNQANVAFSNGADGIFLINHEVSARDLLRSYFQIRRTFPNRFIGFNFLGTSPFEILETVAYTGLSAIWADDSQINDTEIEEGAKTFWNTFTHLRWNVDYYASVAFKGQESVSDPAQAARNASGFCDVVVTSGPSTGFAPDVEKIRVMKKAIGTKPLALASGVTADNVLDFLPYVDIFMVATGISDSFTELNADKTRELANLVHTN